MSEIEAYILFLEKYCTAIFNILEEEYIKAHIIEKYQIISLINVFKKSVIAFSIENHEIKVGDWIIIETSKKRFYKKQIKSLQKNNIDYQNLNIIEKAEIAVMIEDQEKLSINNKCNFYIIKQ